MIMLRSLSYGHLLLSHGDIDFVFSVIWDIYFSKVYALHRLYVPKKSDVIVDAGSHLGLYMLWLVSENQR